MKTLIKISWRNIWRSPRRSLIVITAISLGLFAGVFLMAFYFGLIDQRMQDVIENEVSHIQIHNPKFKEDQRVKYDINNAETIANYISKDGLVKSFALRYISNAMVGSAKGNAGVVVRGIDPEQEKRLIHLDERMTEGDYFQGIKKNPILIGEHLAEKLKVKLRSKIVLTFQNGEGDITSAAFRIVGLYKTANSKYDEVNVFVRGEDLSTLLGPEIGYHEVAILLNDTEKVDSFWEELKTKYPNLSVERWLDILPEMKYMMEVMDTFMSVFILIIMLAVVFGIINTMLMAILERVRELGVLMAIGMNKVRIFFMIMTETVLLTMIGVPVGFLAGFIFITYTSHTGIDFSLFTEALRSFGYTTTVYPLLEGKYYWQTAIEVFVLAVFASVYPAWRALRLKPAESIRKI